jgi:hypothetical protein
MRGTIYEDLQGYNNAVSGKRGLELGIPVKFGW